MNWIDRERLYDEYAMKLEVRTSRLSGAPCPACSCYLDVASGIGVPKPGDFTLCGYCFVYLVFTADGFRILSNAEWLELPAGQRGLFSRLREQLQKFKEAHD